MKKKITVLMQKFSIAAVAPITFMAVMGLVIAFAVILQLQFMPEFIVKFGTLLKKMMDAFMANLALIFCTGITVTLAKTKKADAAILSIIVFVIYLGANNAWLTMNNMIAEPGVSGLFGTGQAVVLGLQVIDMNVLLGMILGCLTGYIHNKFSSIEFPDMFRIYGGARLSFMIMIPILLGLAIASCYVWPVVNSWIVALTVFIKDAGNFGIFLYGFLNHALIPTGLHHFVWMPFCYTQFGGALTIAEQTAVGAYNIHYLQMANPALTTAIDESLRFATFGFVKVWGNLGLGLALIKAAKPKNKALVKGLILPVMLVSIIAGITEPMDFTYFFAAPILYIVRAILDGIFEVVLWVAGSRVFSSRGLLDTVINLLAQDPNLTKPWIYFAVGICGTAVYYFVSLFIIKKLKLKTPGRDDDDSEIFGEEIETNVKKTATSFDEDIPLIIEGLGGRENIVRVDCCFSRLRCELKDITKVDDNIIAKTSSSKGIVKKENEVQIIIGVKVQTLREKVCLVLGLE